MNLETNIISKEKFKVIGKNTDQMESISRPTLSYWQDAWRRICSNKVAFISLFLIIAYIIFAIFAPILSSWDYTKQDASMMSKGISVQHWFGTDSLGRDLFVRVWMGARVSLTIGFIAAIVNAVIGTLIGGMAGYYSSNIIKTEKGTRCWLQFCQR